MVPTPQARSSLPIAQQWYSALPRANDIVQIREACIDPYLTGDLWLVRGSERSLLVDTGTGMVAPRAAIEALSPGPLLALVTNGWYDHAGGLFDFDARLCHAAEAARIADPTPDSSLASLYVSAAMLHALPRPDFRIEAYRMRGTEVTQTVDDGAVIDLGDRRIRVLNLPGDTPGHLALFEEASGTLFTGDSLFDDPAPESRAHYHATLPPPSAESSAQRARNLKRLGELPVDTVCAGHFGQFGRQRLEQLLERQAMA